MFYILKLFIFAVLYKYVILLFNREEEILMKKIMTILAMCCAFIAYTNTSNAQGISANNAISIDPISLLSNGTLNATFESKINSSNSFTIFGSYYQYKKDNFDWSGFGFGGSYRWYIDIFSEGKRGFNGFSVGPMAKVTFWSWNGTENLYKNSTEVTIGLEAAYKWVFSNQWAVEPRFYYGIDFSNIDGLNYVPWGIGVNLGYVWK